MSDTERAPIVYLPDGTPVKVRLIGATCEGDVSGEGHYGYYPQDLDGEDPTVYFESVPSVECVHCGDDVAQSLIEDHHVNEHPMERWNPAFYPELFEGDREIRTDGGNASDGTDRCLVLVESETHEGEWLRMVSCPIPHCDAVLGVDYGRFSSHLAAEHGPEDIGLSSDGRRVATDGGGTERNDACPRCGGTARFTAGRGPYCRSCGWCAERPPRPLRSDTDRNGGDQA